ncbi:HNH endonuclease signature motif containing protein [Agreia sp. Leaf283]|uniref:HNH endonuclease signature motif containing protein n=1 Tax=Agreia sp. Leaf283 TaxID=1736321 RepID=UPI0006FB382A|nr:HNH endonuclease signature motif containing protein [Agreia sp. Leaf283]KQP57347.1 hypothetical protein ASF51_05720 [Agreia sp. Leaf283]
MDLLDASLGDIAERLRELLDENRAAVNTGAGSGADSGDALLEAAHAWEAIGRAGDAARTWVAAEVAHDSRRELDTAGLAYRHGFASAKKLLAATTNISERTAATRISLGQRLRSSISISGTPNPSFFPVVEAAFFAGQVGVDTAAVICRTLSEVVNRTGWSDATDRAERHLVAAAIATVADAAIDADADSDADTGVEESDGTDGADAFWRVPRRYTVEEIGRLAIRIREHLDPDGAEPRDAAKQSLRGFSYPKVGADGMARGRYALPPLQLGVFLAAVDSVLSPRTPDTSNPSPHTASQDATDLGHTGAGITENQGIAGGEENGPLTNDPSQQTSGAKSGTPDDHTIVDSRTAEQKLLDAVMTLLELAATSPSVSLLNGAAPTVNVHVTLDDLESGRGAAWIDGSTEPIPISTIDQLRCHGDTITTLFGQHGEILHHGKTKRLATRRQRRALAARDGGCVIPGCTAPPSRCQAHHVTPWVSEDYPPGRTDIDNLALLCPFHHSTIHTSAWQLVMIHGKPHVRPPSWQDPNRTPRPAAHQRTGRPW